MSDSRPFDSAGAIARDLAAGARSARDVLERHLAAIAEYDPSVGAFCCTFSDRARHRADELDRARAVGAAPGALLGVPVACKDNLLVEGQHASAGSRMLASFVAPFTATSLARLEAEGAVLLGRTNMDEFGMGSTTETSALGRTRNPFGRDLVPGGSSGGSAAAVAAGLCPLAVGSDTGGSVRQPAALCGVTGLKPTYGRVPRYGLIAYASSLDCVGAIARSAEDLALWLDCASGHDPADPTSLPASAASPAALAALADAGDLRGVRLGVPAELHGAGVDDEVLASCAAAEEQLRGLGAELVPCALPTAEHAVSAYYLLATAEAASNLARYDGVHYGHRGQPADGARRETAAAMTTRARTEGFGDEVQLRVLLGTFASSYGYSARFHDRAKLARAAVRRDFARAFADCDALVFPTSPTAAQPFGTAQDDPVKRYLWDALTVPASLAGLPALSMPCAPTADGRPVGLQVVAPHGRDDRALRIAHVFQQHTDHHHRRPTPLAEAL